MSPALVPYEHFLGIAARIEWDADAINLAGDAARWPELNPARHERVIAFTAAFALAEERVALDLEPFAAAATSPEMAACFRAQARDEARHARFFDRYAREVLRTDELGGHVAPDFAELFEERLGAAARALASGRLSLADAVTLYHLVLEGVVFTAGQNALLAELRAIGDLPGLCEGMERVVADERWHIGFGVRILRDDSGGRVVASDAEEAIGVWGSLLPAAERDATLRLHRRRLAAAGLAG